MQGTNSRKINNGRRRRSKRRGRLEGRLTSQMWHSMKKQADKACDNILDFQLFQYRETDYRNLYKAKTLESATD